MTTRIRLALASLSTLTLLLLTTGSASAQETDDLGDVVDELGDTPLVDSILDAVAAVLRFLGIS